MEESNKNFIIVLKSGCGETISVEVFPEDTVKDLKQRIETQIGIPLDFDQIKIDGKTFNDDTNIIEYFSPETIYNDDIELKNYKEEKANNSFEENINITTKLKDTFLEASTSFNENRLKSENLDAGLHCAALGCTSTKLNDPNVQLFKFPAQKKRCQQWLLYAQRFDLIHQSLGYLSHHLALCSKHFSKDQFTSKDCRFLKQSAIPTLFEITEENEDLETITIQQGEIETNKETQMGLDEDKMIEGRDEEDEEGINEDSGDNFEEGINDEEEEEAIEELEPLHPGAFCRLCGNLFKGSDSTFIFGDDGEKKCLAEKINSCLPISVRKTDPLPKQICLNCMKNLEAVHIFAETCIKAEIKLKTLTKRFLVHQLKNNITEIKNQKSFCCPLCRDGAMKYHGNHEESKIQNVVCLKKESNENNLKIPSGFLPVSKFEPEDSSHDFLNDLYSDEDESSVDLENSQNESKDTVHDLSDKNDISVSLYLQEDQVDMLYDCSICEENFLTPFECYEHCKMHASSNNFPCLVCGLSFQTEAKLKEHFAGHKNKINTARKSQYKPMLECGACKFQFTTRKDFILHKCSKPILKILQSGSVSLYCHSCDKHFKTFDRAESHRSYHEGTEKLPCKICEMQFETEGALAYHETYQHENQEPFTCRHCGLRFFFKLNCEKHERVHESTTYQCSLCNKTYKDLEKVTTHIEAHGRMTPECATKLNLKCPKCDLQFTKKAHYLYHVENFHDGDMNTMKRMPSLIQYQCKICSERFTLSQDVIIHRTVHWKTYDSCLPHVCEYCGEAHPSPNALARHRRILHPDEQPYVCTICETTTRTLYEARVHRKTHTGCVNAPQKPPSKVYICDNCPSLFSDKASFLSHKKSHKVSKGFQCEYCQKIFPERHRLVVHRRQHTGEKPFSCGVCGKKFAQTSAMYTHALLHTGETPHSCDLCGRRFRIKSDRDNHRRTHTGEKPYKCLYCDKSFRTGQVYYQHRMIHTGERRFPCDICGRAFKRSHTLVCHRRIHTGEKPNICDVCGKGFRQRTDMRKHKMNLHGVPA